MTHYFKITFLKEWQATWTSTYSNLAPFAFGLCFGYLYIRYEKHKYAKVSYQNVYCWVYIIIIIIASDLYKFVADLDYTSNSWNPSSICIFYDYDDVHKSMV